MIGVDDRESLVSSIASVLSDISSRSRVHRHIDGIEDAAVPLRKTAAELGWLTLGVDERDGGLGLGEHGLALLAQELGRWLAPGAFIPTLAVAQLLSEFAPSAVRETLLPDLLSGVHTAAIPAGFGRAAESSGPLFGDANSVCLVAAFSGDAGGPLRILHSDAPAASQGMHPELWDRTRQLCGFPDNAELACELPAQAAERLVVLVNLMLTAESVGLMDAIFRQTVEYLGSREQFGVKIGSFQALKHRAADLATSIELARCALEQSLEAAASGGAEAMLWSAACKASVADTAVLVAQECLQFHGGIGFTWEYDCHLFLKRARLNQMLGEDNSRLRLDAFDLLMQRRQRGETSMEICA